MKNSIKISIAQITPVWLKKNETIEKILSYINLAAKDESDIICFGETCLPGYPFWLENTDAARFNNTLQKEIFAWYLQEAVDVNTDLKDIQKRCKESKINLVLGLVEKAKERGSHSIYCSLVYIDFNGLIKNVHRKIMPTYEERLVWSIGDGHGLKTFPIEAFTIGGLNCWENWIPSARSSLYAQGENLHIAVWPGSDRNTKDITRFIAQESRSYVVSVSSLLSKKDIPKELPFYSNIIDKMPDILANGGSCIAKPDGNWLIEPITNEEIIKTVELNIKDVFMERQNFDPSGHYSRPDILQLNVNRDRQKPVKFNDESD